MNDDNQVDGNDDANTVNNNGNNTDILSAHDDFCLKKQLQG